MSEHWFLAAMLAVVGLETLVAIYLAYHACRISERIEGLTAATYLEAREILSQLR